MLVQHGINLWDAENAPQRGTVLEAGQLAKKSNEVFLHTYRT